MSGLTNQDKMPLSTFLRPVWNVVRKTPKYMDPFGHHTEFHTRLNKRVPESDSAHAASHVLAAAHLARVVWGEAALHALPELLNMAALAIASRKRMVVHAMKASAVRLVNATDVHEVPAQWPEKMDAFILEARHADRGEVLYGETMAVGGYRSGDRLYLIELGITGWSRVQSFRPGWTHAANEFEACWGDGPKSARIDDAVMSPMWHIQDADRGVEPSFDPLRFVVTYALLLDADRTPIVAAEDGTVPGRRVSRRKHNDEEWRTTYVSLRSQMRARASTKAEPETQPREPIGEAITTSVSGHLKRQPCGPGASERKWIYVEKYSARRWVSPGVIRVVS